MLKIAKLLLLMICIDCTAHSQESSAKLLRDASHCLATEKQDWLAIQKKDVKTLEFAYVIDSKSDPGVNHIYVVVYTNTEHSTGRVFDLRYKKKGEDTLFDVQNNASFARSGKEITFVDPPLGGTWTQTHLLSAIKQAGRSTSIALNVQELTASFPGISCESYPGNK